MEEVNGLGAVIAKTLALADEVTRGWVSVGDYVVSADGASLQDVTALECGREMYVDVMALVSAFVGWVLPALTDIAYGLAMTY